MRRLLLLALSLLASGAAAQTMQKCVDERGVTHYSDRPEPGCKGKEVEIHGQPPISGKLSPRKEDLKREERDLQRRRVAEEKARAADVRAAEAEQRRCAQMRTELQRLESGRRTARVDEKGTRSYIEDEERSRRAAKLREEIAQKCR